MSDSPTTKPSPTLLLAPLPVPTTESKVTRGHKYVTILDAGSSGTRIYVYRYATDDDGKAITPLELTLIDEKSSNSLDTGSRRGLHEQITWKQVGNHLLPLLRYARGKLNEFGATDVPIYLLATQGMRNKQSSGGNPSAMRILDWVYNFMVAEKGGVFLIGRHPRQTTEPNRSARIISGQVEGILAWVSVNYGFAPRRISNPTIAIFEIGGASAQIAYEAEEAAEAAEDDVKKVCLASGEHHVYAKTWENYGMDTEWNRILRKVPGDAGDEVEHPCLRGGQTVVVDGVTYKGSAASDDKWEQCFEYTNELIGGDDDIPRATTEFFYGLGTPIEMAAKKLNSGWFRFGHIQSVKYNHAEFIASNKAWCERVYQVPANNTHEDHPDNPFYIFALKRCASSAWFAALMQNRAFYTDDNFKTNFYIPTSRELKSRTTWTLGAAALIARAQSSENPLAGLKGCPGDDDGLEVMGTFNGLTDGMKDDFVVPADEPAFDDEYNDEVFTTADTHLIESSEVPSSAKFIHSLSNNNFITAQFSLSFANFAIVAVLLVAIGAWVYRRASRRASPNIFLPGDMVKL